MEKKYTDYQDVDKEQLQKDIEEIKQTVSYGIEEDLIHLKKMERWGWYSTALGYGLLIGAVVLESVVDIHRLLFYLLLLLSAIFLGIANVNKWANVAHPILHGAYDKVPDVPQKYTKENYSQKGKRFFHWFDWIKPEAWIYEHNIMHHYHLGEQDDPDNVEKNTKWLHQKKIPMWMKYAIVILFAFTWKVTYYAPNTLRILRNKKNIKEKKPLTKEYIFNPLKEDGYLLWRDYYLPYGLYKFLLIPLLFLPFGLFYSVCAFFVMLVAEFYANLHSFLVIVPNHSADDIYQFSTPHKSKGEYYLRQIMGSVNYKTGNDVIDFLHGFLNYQIEHHLFPDMPLNFYQKMQPIVKEVCEKHNLEYRQDSVFKRMKMTLDLMVGKTKLLTIEGV